MRPTLLFPCHFRAAPSRSLGAVAALALLAFVGCSGAESSTAETGGERAQDAGTAQDPQPQTEQPLEYVHMRTSMGDVVIELNREKAPVTVENFLEYVNDRFYDNTIFHRVIAGFVIQGGGFTAEMDQKQTRPPIANEWRNGLKNERGTLSMARTNDPDSATSQFFINVVDNESLDQPMSGGAGYAVFGKVYAGMDVIDKIRRVPTTTRGGHRDVPLEPVSIERATHITKDEAEALKEKIEAGPGQADG